MFRKFCFLLIIIFIFYILLVPVFNSFSSDFKLIIVFALVITVLIKVFKRLLIKRSSITLFEELEPLVYPLVDKKNKQIILSNNGKIKTIYTKRCR